MPLKILSVHLADGFVDDCEELIHKCVQTDTLNYQIFCNIWKDMNFALIYHGRTSGAEVAELTEEFLFIAKRYMCGNSSNFEESVAGLFLVYALLNLQPYKGFAPFRITPPDLEAIHCIEEVARKQKRHDVLYILGSLLIEGPVEWHLAERQYGLERQLRKAFDVTTTIDKVGVRPKGVFYRQNEELDLIRELSALSRRYCKAKAAISGTSRPDRTLNYVDEHMANELGASLKLLISGKEGTTPDGEHSRSDAIQKIKHRAMADTVHQMKHLMSTDDKAAESPSTSKTKGPRRKKRKIGDASRKGTLSPTPMNMTTDDELDESILMGSDLADDPPRSPRKRKPKTNNHNADKSVDKKNTDAKPSKGKTTDKIKGKKTLVKPRVKKNSKKRKILDSSSSDSNVEISDLESDNLTDEASSEEDTMDSYLKKMQSNPVIVELEPIATDGAPTPAINYDVEIEFVGDFDKPKETETKDVAMEEKVEVTVANDDYPVKKEVKKKKVKRTHLKSKLSRLGLLQVADIEEDESN